MTTMLVHLVSALLLCCATADQTTMQYTYTSYVYLWGETKQTFRVSASVEVDEIGPARGPYEGTEAVLYLVHLYHINIEAIKDGKVVKNKPDVKKPQLDELYGKPFRFIQKKNLEIAEVQFQRSDIENTEAVNFKKGVLSAFQAHNDDQDEEDVEETDVLGRHTTHYRVTHFNHTKQIKKSYKTDDIKTFGNNDVNKDGVDVDVEEETTVDETNRITETKGVMKIRIKRNIAREKRYADENSPHTIYVMAKDVDIADNFDSDNTYDMKFNNETRRSSSRKRRMAELDTSKGEDSFITTSLIGDFSPENAKMHRYNKLLELVEEEGLTKILKRFYDTPTDGDILRHLREALNLENLLHSKPASSKDHGNTKPKNLEGATHVNLIDKVVKETKTKLSDCLSHWDLCKGIVNLYIVGGQAAGEKMIKVMLAMDISDTNLNEFLSLLTPMKNPSDALVNAVRKKYQDESSEVKTTLMFTLTALAGERSVSEELRAAITKSMLEKLSTINKDNCQADDSMFDVLEATGNLADPAIIDRMIQIGKDCMNKPALVMGTVHALAEICSDQRVVEYYTFLIENAVCDVKLTVIGSMRDKISSDIVEGRHGSWPREEYNSLDLRLKDIYNENSGDFHCIHDEIFNYFSDKPDNRGEGFLTSGGRSKRGLSHYSCSAWGPYGSRYTSIQSSSSFSSDNWKYPDNRHCLAHFRLGVSSANANLYAGAFAGINRKYCNWKIFARVYANANVLGKSFYIASAHFYQYKYGTLINLRAYLKIGYKTYVDYTSRIKTTLSQTWSRDWHWDIDIWGINIYVASLTLRVTIKPRVDFKVKINPCNSGCAVCATVTPKATLQISGGAAVSVLGLKGGLDVNVRLNYLVDGVGKIGVYSGVCVGLYHGHDPMTVFFSAWYQWWWGGRQTWSPNTLSWRVASASRKTIYWNCLAGWPWYRRPVFTIASRDQIQIT
ncbi:unnamed protein product [Owenia fusiformis]|uniref:Vitellogenin domain-containing protein n=1 Tax=Owenia fusiformis TaxID=6347 RepID=A0A8J1YBM1_OWEFU|nr:unnamed protein product [Owenia fusiformis]